jgi:hypothetical protein
MKQFFAGMVIALDVRQPRLTAKMVAVTKYIQNVYIYILEITITFTPLNGM